jgi:hypothetical protein
MIHVHFMYQSIANFITFITILLICSFLPLAETHSKMIDTPYFWLLTSIFLLLIKN